jgi:hypothetical protein
MQKPRLTGGAFALKRCANCTLQGIFTFFGYQLLFSFVPHLGQPKMVSPTNAKPLPVMARAWCFPAWLTWVCASLLHENAIDKQLTIFINRDEFSLFHNPF